MYRLQNQGFELLVFREIIEAIVLLLLSCFAVLLFWGGVVLLFLSLTVYTLSALINPNIFPFFFCLINYLFSMILSVCLCSLHYFTFMCLFFPSLTCY